MNDSSVLSLEALTPFQIPAPGVAFIYSRRKSVRSGLLQRRLRALMGIGEWRRRRGADESLLSSCSSLHLLHHCGRMYELGGATAESRSEACLPGERRIFCCSSRDAAGSSQGTDYPDG
jgi:hypothetical protein